MADVSISYKGNEIASMNATGVKTLLTSSAFCEDDITVTYTKPAAPVPTLQTKSATYTPSTSQQTATITYDVGYDGLDEVNVTVDAMPSGTAGTPTATKGTVSGNSVSVTPSVTNTTGYITGGTKTGTPVTVSASELVSGTKTISASGTTDVTNYASASVAAGSAATPATTITANPSISVSSGGLITASVSASKSVTPTVSAGYVSSGTAGTVSVSGSNTSQLTTQAAQTITPTTTNQTIASGKYLTGTQTILGSENLLPENIKKDVVIFGITGTYEGDVPSGYTVTVSLTNPSHPSAFISCHIYEALSNDLYDWGNEIGSVSSPTGSTEITVPASVYGICVNFSGSSMYTEISNCTCTGGVSVEETDYAGTFLFSVSGNGTITIDGVEYAD